ncbi:neurogenic locus Notch protein-like [Orbicella faveolata]|uniref:neurogenic locus Notch protein-like n=1 Tax=Orbicella faveolata TaxID=48498 RepID=UPI0009E2FE1D|nr:neurogenic locus Notch protein-like [Orbicella faveolata]XP_020601162.1 neurogenic locus Notch protein-like [Orbicella faveolata]
MLPYLEFILLFVSLFPKNTAGSNSCRTSFSDTDHVLTGHVMQTLNHKSFESCTFSCELEPQCFSVNYISLHKTCQLNDATKEYFPGDLVKQKGSFYMGMVIRSYNPCASMRCENGGTCVSRPSLKCKCLKGFSGPRCETLQALGMESGTIPDGNIKASSEKTGYDAWKGRLNGQSCWMPENDKTTEYIVVTFATVVRIVAIATQGAPKDGCWVKSFSIRYGAASAVVVDPEVKNSLYP